MTTRKARNLRVIAGTLRPCRDALEPALPLPLVTEVPPAPDWLPNAHAVGEWDRLAPLLVANGLLSQAGLSAFGVLCALHGKLVQLWAAGESPRASTIAQYRGLVNDFGFTPMSQGRVKPAGERGALENRFSHSGRRPT